MSDFFDNEAEVSEGSEDEEVRDEIRKHKKFKNVKREDSDEEEEEDDDDGKVFSFLICLNIFLLFVSISKL